MTAGNEGAKESSHATFGFLHDDEFSQLLRVAQAEAGLDVEFVEKDYLVTHVLWWLHHDLKMRTTLLPQSRPYRRFRTA